MRQRRQHDRQPVRGSRRARPEAVRSAGPAGPIAAVLALQRNAGNAAVARLLSGGAPIVVQRSLTGMFLDPTPAEGSVVPAKELGGSLTSKQFEVRAKIVPSADETEGCKNGQYRQAIRGEFRRNGVAQEHDLVGGPMKMDTYLEDKIGTKRYGYRGSSGGAPSAYFSDEACTNGDLQNGCYFRSYDTPSAAPEDDEMELHFRGSLFDIRTAQVLDRRTWSVYGKKEAATED